MTNFYLIGLTGNLGSGKSTVRRMLEQLGAYGMDADKLAHAAMQRGTPTWKAIADSFGAQILKSNGKIDRQKLGARVFENPEALRQLEAILHPAVGEIIKQSLRQTQSPVVVVEAIKLFEANLHLWCDALWVVTAAPQVQLERVMRDRQMSADDARARLDAQSSSEEKLRRANVVIDNSGDLDSTLRQVQTAWQDTVRLDQARDKTEWLYGIVSAQPIAPPLPPEPPITVIEAALEPEAMPPETAAVQAPVEPSAVTIEPQETQPVEVPAAEVEPIQTSAPVEPIVQAAPPVEEPQPTASAEVTEIEVRRARRGDLETLAVALAKREGRSDPLGRAEVIQRFGERGYRIAVGGKRIVALAAWEAENLVATLRDLWAESAEIAPRAIPPLIALVEEDARALQCEVSLLLVNPQAEAFVAEQVSACEYQRRELNSLHRNWRQVVEERLQPGEQIWVKRLREGFVTKPI